MQEKIAAKNALTFYSVAKLYKLPSVAKSSMSFVDRCFSMLVESQDFLQLDFSCLAKILASSELDIHSEVEIFDAAVAWLKHNSEERSKYAKQLLLKVRITLLPEQTINYLLEKGSPFHKNTECFDKLKEVLCCEKTIFQNKNRSYYTRRCCVQDKFNLLTLGGCYKSSNKNLRNLRKVSVIDGKRCQIKKFLPSMKRKRRNFEAVCLKGEIYVFGNDMIITIEKYSPSANKWSDVAVMADFRERFGVCAYRNKILVIGGAFHLGVNNITFTSLSLEFSPKEKKWLYISGMTKSRISPACAVFNEKIVAAGGYCSDLHRLNTVESYDVFAGTWSPMPNMNTSKTEHSVVVARNRLFVLGTDECEVFDDFSEKFVVLKSERLPYINKALWIGNKIIVFHDSGSDLSCYDIDKDEWSSKCCQTNYGISGFACVKLPCF